MEKNITNIDILSNINNGISITQLICPNCKTKNRIINKHKLNYTKIKSIKCSKCKTTINIGDIYNFRTGTKLNDINKSHNQELLDEYIWDSTHNKY